jgi:hypothetical protein
MARRTTAPFTRFGASARQRVFCIFEFHHSAIQDDNSFRKMSTKPGK